RSSRTERCPVPEPRSSRGPSTGRQARTCSSNWPARRSMTASRIDFNITHFEQPCRCTRFVPHLKELLDEPQDLRPETPFQVAGMNRKGRDSTIKQLKQPPDSMPNVPEPAPATTVPGPGRQGNPSARP